MITFDGSNPNEDLIHPPESFRAQSHRRLMAWKSGGYDSSTIKNELKMKSLFSDQTELRSKAVLKSARLQNPKITLRHLEDKSKETEGYFSRFNNRLTKKGSYYIRNTEST